MPVGKIRLGAAGTDGGDVTNANPLPARAAPAGTSVCTNVAGATGSTVLLAANGARLGATFYNDSTANLYLKLGATASTTSFSARILPGGYYELPFSYTGEVDGVWDAAAGAARVTELSP
jgi:hypothetical protein